MYVTQNHSPRIALAVAMALLMALSLAPRAVADTFISGFEGDLSSTLGVNWELSDTDDQTPGDQTWTSAIVTQGVTEGSQAVQLSHPIDLWQAGFRLNTPALIDLVETHDAVSFDVTASPDATWRGVWFVMQGDGLGWTQSPSQVDVFPGITSTVTFDLAPWKAGAAASGGTWWQALIVFMGGDGASPETYTIIDNFRFVGSAPGSPADFNSDGDVDGDDLAEWRLGFNAPNANGDADGDLDTDGEDFLIWQRELDVPGAVAIPEPATVSLALAAAVAGYVGFARRRRVG